MLRALLLLPLLAWPAAAQEIPSCTPARAGATACLSGKLCECRFERGGSITGTRDGYRWDCGVLRPACGEALPPPGAAPMSPGLLPELYLQLGPPGSSAPGKPAPSPGSPQRLR